MIALPFGGAVLQDLGSSKEEVDAILEEKRRELVVLRNAKSLIPDNKYDVNDTDDIDNNIDHESIHNESSEVSDEKE